MLSRKLQSSSEIVHKETVYRLLIFYVNMNYGFYFFNHLNRLCFLININKMQCLIFKKQEMSLQEIWQNRRFFPMYAVL